MFECPNCKDKGIGIWSKIWSGSDSPSTCKICSRLSYVPVKYRLGSQPYWPFIVSWTTIGLTAYLFLLTGLLFFLILIPLIWIAGKFFELASLPMVPISEEESKASKKAGNWFLLVIIVLMICVISLINL